MSRRPIKLTVFIHDDLKDSEEDALYADHFDWLVNQLEHISGRRVQLNLIKPVHAPQVSNYNYNAEHLDLLMSELESQVRLHSLSEPKSPEHLDLPAEQDTAADKSLNKFLLLTRNPVNSGVLGVAYAAGDLAIASITPKFVAAHEVGHMLGARHEDVDETFKTSFGTRKTIMYKNRDDAMAFAFSKQNQENIRNYLNQFD